MKKYFLPIVLSFVFFINSCVSKDYATQILITNKSNQDLGRIELYAVGSSKSEILLIQKDMLNKDGKIESSFLQSALPKSDGSYLIKIVEKSNSRQEAFGYFTNGNSMDASISISVEPNTISVKTTNRKDGY
jgi:hypothetical protein